MTGLGHGPIQVAANGQPRADALEDFHHVPRAARSCADSSGNTFRASTSIATPYSRRAYSGVSFSSSTSCSTRSGSRSRGSPQPPGPARRWRKTSSRTSSSVHLLGSGRASVSGFKTLSDGVPGRPPARPIAPRVLRRDLLLEHVLQHALGIALEGIAPAAGPGQEVAEDVAVPDLERALARELARVRVGVQDIVGRRAGAAAGQAVGQEAAAVGAELERARPLEKAVLARDGEAPAELAGAARVGDVAVALDQERVLGLDHLDRVVREVDDAAAAGVHAVPGRAAAPGAEEELEEHEGPALRVVAAEAHAGVAAHLAGEDAVGRDLGERAEQRIGEAEAGEAARRDGGGQDGIHDGAGRRDDLDRAEIALVVRRIAADQMPHRRVDGGLGERQRRVDGPAHLGRRAGEIRDEPVARHRDRHHDRDRVGVDAVVVDPVGERVGAVGHLRRWPTRASRSAWSSSMVVQALKRSAPCWAISLR